ncbi:MAG: DUF6713 family protein [bacterium]
MMKLKIRSLAVPLAVANLAFLALHQLDAVYWKEWQMIGGAMNYQAFLFITFLLCVPGIFYISKLTQGKRSGFVYSLIWSLIGFVVPIFHSYFFFIADVQVRAPLSIFLIYAVGLLSLPLFMLSVDGFKNTVEEKAK